METKRLAAAYKVLSSATKRRSHDELLTSVVSEVQVVSVAVEQLVPYTPKKASQFFVLDDRVTPSKSNDGLPPKFTSVPQRQDLGPLSASPENRTAVTRRQVTQSRRTAHPPM
jgi:hypothetical protein